MNDSILRLAISGLGAICCLCIVGIVVIAALGHEPPPILGAMGSSTAGALVGILVQTGQRPANNSSPTNPTPH